MISNILILYIIPETKSAIGQMTDVSAVILFDRFYKKKNHPDNKEVI